MILQLLIFVPMFGTALWLMVRSVPSTAPAVAASRYKAIAAILAAVVCGGYSLVAARFVAAEEDSPWWPALAAAGAVLVVLLTTLGARLRRNMLE